MFLLPSGVSPTQLLDFSNKTKAEGLRLGSVQSVYRVSIRPRNHHETWIECSRDNPCGDYRVSSLLPGDYTTLSNFVKYRVDKITSPYSFRFLCFILLQKRLTPLATHASVDLA